MYVCLVLLFVFLPLWTVCSSAHGEVCRRLDESSLQAIEDEGLQTPIAVAHIADFADILGNPFSLRNR